MKRPWMRAATIAGVLALTALAACSGKAPAGSGGHDPVPVTVGVVTQMNVPIVINEIGSVEAYSTVDIKAQIGGELIEVGFREGQDVQRGALLFRIDPRPYEAALKSAQAQLEKDSVQLKTAQQDLARYGDLVKKDYVTQEEYERIRTNAASLEAAVAADRAAVDNATVQLEYCTIRSPIVGRTGKLMVNRGNLVKSNADTPLVVINQIDPIYVAFSVPQRELPEIKSRRAAGSLVVQAVIPDSAVQPPPGTLSFIDNAVNTTTGSVLLKATFPNRDRVLWPGQFVTVSLQVSMQPNALLVPTQAIQTGQQGPYVYVVKPDLTVESRPIVPGGVYEHETIVEKGIAAGERVVKDGQIRLVPGASIRIQEDAAGGSAPAAPATSPPGTEARR
ncbi:MAG: efflux RND transporter periplasmic adaptor subunit [Acidobacteria bacterium]|nr:MAG: efflux RND transporter periplasmic adaptor subunit [Acidobacteriota bacterium]